MKKLMMALAVVAFATGVQAATVSWKIGEDGFPGKQDGTYAKKDVYLVLATAGQAYDDFISGLADGSINAGNITSSSQYMGQGQTTASSGKLTRVDSDYGTTYGTPYTVAFVAFDTSASGDDYYYLSVTKTATSWGDATHPDGSQTIANFTESNYKASNWHKVESVPEPTSGLLLLLGMAGLALRRRRV